MLLLLLLLLLLAPSAWLDGHPIVPEDEPGCILFSRGASARSPAGFSFRPALLLISPPFSIRRERLRTR